MLLKKSKKVNQPIGVFDSGVGGLSVLLEIQKLLPNENYIFLADQARIPYGEKTPEELEKISLNVGNFLHKEGVKMIVVACNTATCHGIDALRNTLPIPIVGTVPAIKPALENSKTGKVGVISTPMTSKSKTLKDLIDKYGNGNKVVNIGCPGLEDIVERGDINSEDTKKLLNRYLDSFRNTGIDYLVLGCTHYPFLKRNIKDYLGDRVNIIDSGAAIALQVSRILIKEGLKNGQIGEGITQYYTTGDPVAFSRSASGLLGRAIDVMAAEF